MIRTFLPRSGAARLASWVAVLSLWMCGSALAADWTIQTVALRDLREAQATAEDLRSFGLDAYTEFAMWEGEQFVRVRFGCFTTRDAADEMALRVRTHFVADAVSVERTPGAPSKGCLEESTGFLKPAHWRQLVDGVPVFEVTLAGTTAIVQHNGRRWRIHQAGATLPDQQPPATPRFSQGLLGDIPVVHVQVHHRESPVDLVLCPGRLLGEVEDVAVVDRGDRIVTCRLRSAGAVVEGS